MIEELKISFEKYSDSDRAVRMAAYMKDKFEFYGIPSPTRKSIQNEVFSKYSIKDSKELESVILQLWDLDQREFIYAAIDLAARNRKVWAPELIVVFEKLLISKSWWDSVDGMTSNCIAPFFKKFPDSKNEWIEKWRIDGNMWLNRVSIIHQLGLKNQTDTDLLTLCILTHSSSKEFFIQKAIGWALRQYAKFNPEWVLNFVEVNPLKSLSKREAVKNIRL